MKNIAVIFAIVIFAGAVIGAIYFTQSKDLANNAAHPIRMDAETIAKKLTEDNWQESVVLQYENYSDAERREIRKGMGGGYEHFKLQPWNTEDLNPYSNGNVKLLLNSLGQGGEGTWEATYINIDLQDIVDNFPEYAGELIHLEQSRLIDSRFIEAGSDESKALFGAEEEFGIITYETVKGNLFQLLILPPGARRYYESLLSNTETEAIITQDVTGCPVGVLDNKYVVLAIW